MQFELLLLVVLTDQTLNRGRRESLAPEGVADLDDARPCVLLTEKLFEAGLTDELRQSRVRTLSTPSNVEELAYGAEQTLLVSRLSMRLLLHHD